MYAKRSKTYAAADIADADGVKTSFATVAAPVVLVPADFNGAAMTTGGVLDLPRSITITRSSAANQFSVSPIVITGTRGGVEVTESLTPANNDGNDVLRGTQAFDVITSISLPTAGGTGGAYTIGVQDICAPSNGVFCGVEMAAAGNLIVGYGGNDLTGWTSDTIPVPAVAAGFVKEIAPRRILTQSMSVGLTVYLP
ncbi:hypothetical protein [Caudoviricetes sp.]|nr:hypothetical protein [Caudoviricetes sp.]